MFQIYFDRHNQQWFNGLLQAQGNQHESLVLGSNFVVINNFKISKFRIE